MRTIIHFTILVPLCGDLAVAQTREPTPKFDAASIKRSAPGPGGTLWHLPGGRFKADKLTLISLISFSYEVPDAQIIGLPKWGSTDRFDVEAVGDGPPESDPKKMESPLKKAMVRQLLEERFQLEVRREERDSSIYSLVVAPGGSKMEHNSDKPYMIKAGKRSFTFQKVSTANLVKFLSSNVRRDIGRVVVDKTGLEGDFDFTLTWAPLQVGNSLPIPDSSQAPTIRTSENLPSIFTAVQEQLGLKLQSDHGLVPFLVVVKATPPSEN